MMSASARSGQSRQCLPSLTQLQHTSHHSPVSEALVIVKFIANSSKYNHQVALFASLSCLDILSRISVVVFSFIHDIHIERNYMRQNCLGKQTGDSLTIVDLELP